MSSERPQITAADVLTVRNASNRGIREAKEALLDAGGDLDKAIEMLADEGYISPEAMARRYRWRTLGR